MLDPNRTRPRNSGPTPANRKLALYRIIATNVGGWRDDGRSFMQTAGTQTVQYTPNKAVLEASGVGLKHKGIHAPRTTFHVPENPNSPMSLVRKKKKAESLDGVARHRKMKSAGSQTDFCLMADHRDDACSDTISCGLLERITKKGGRGGFSVFSRLVNTCNRACQNLLGAVDVQEYQVRSLQLEKSSKRLHPERDRRCLRYR